MLFPLQRVQLPFILVLIGLILSVPGLSLAVEGEVLESRVLKTGTKAPLFTTPSLEGEDYDLGDVVGKKPVLIFFWSFFCGPCREEMPVLQKIYEEVGEDKIEFVGVNLDGKKLTKAITKFLTDSNMEFKSVFDELDGISYKIADPYGVAGTPTSYIIDMDGNIAFSAVGHIEPDEVKKLLGDLLSGS